MPTPYRQRHSGALIFVPTDEEKANKDNMDAIQAAKEQIEKELAEIKEIKKKLAEQLP